MAARVLESSPHCRLEKARRVVTALHRWNDYRRLQPRDQWSPCACWGVRQALCRTHQEKAVAQLFSGENAMVSHYRQDLAAAVPPPCLDLDHGVTERRGERETHAAHPTVTHSPWLRSMQRRRPVAGGGAPCLPAELQ